MQKTELSRSPDGVSSSPNQVQDSLQMPAPVEVLTQTTVRVNMQSTSSLMNVLVTVSRIGAQIDFVSAKESSAILTISARPNVARRVPSLLRELVEVIGVCEI